MEISAKIPLEKELNKIRPVVALAASTVQRIRERCAYGWVKLNDIAISVWINQQIQFNLYF